MSEETPELETLCPVCRGRGGSTDDYGRYFVCTRCDGAGTMPTAFGDKVWAFVSRRLPDKRREVYGLDDRHRSETDSGSDRGNPDQPPKADQSFVEALRGAGVETFESCEGGDGHAYPEPTVRFHGDRAEGFRALAAALRAGLKVMALRRVWPVLEGEPTGPWWELTFVVPTKGG